jgi:hypothetical protein
MSGMSFAYYAEPTQLLGASRDVIVGLGDVDGTEYAYLGVGGDEFGYGDILLSRELLAHLIDLLSETIGAMDCDLSGT